MKENVFAARTVLSVTMDRPLASANGEWDDIYRILNYMTGRSNFTHQLVPALNACKPALLTAFPELSNVNDDDIERAIDQDRLEEWILSAPTMYGLQNEYEVFKLNDYVVKNPIT